MGFAKDCTINENILESILKLQELGAEMIAQAIINSEICYFVLDADHNVITLIDEDFDPLSECIGAGKIVSSPEPINKFIDRHLRYLKV